MIKKPHKINVINDNLINNVIKNLNILYIEDEINIRENIKKTLQLFCNEVYAFESNLDINNILETKKVDLIISDINLPRKSGIEFAKEIRENYEYVPIIFLTAYTDRKYLLEATKLKLIDYLIKPIDLSALRDALRKTSIEIIESGHFIIEFDNSLCYNTIEKKLYEKNSSEIIELTYRESQLLDLLILHENKHLSIDEIKSNIWQNSFQATDSAFKNLISKLRKKVGKETISNISGVGYKINYHKA